MFEKESKELQKENAELKEKLEKETVQRIYNLNKSIGWKEKHRRLKKENANLKNMIEQEHKAGNSQLIAIREQLNKDVNRQFATGVMTFIFRLYEYVYEKE